MTSPEQLLVEGEGTAPVSNEQPKPRPKRGPNKRSGRGGESVEQARPRPKGDRFSMSVFADGIERAFCTEMKNLLPAAWPVQHRTGLAVIQPIAIARTNGRILLCDCQHGGPHVWPNGDVADALAPD